MVTANRLAAFGGKRAVQDEVRHDWPVLTQEDIDAVIAALRERHWSYYASSKEIRAFERELCGRLDRPFGLAVNSGTSALFLGFFCLDLQPGDDILVPTYTFPATVAPLLHFGARLAFYDTAPCSPVPDISTIAPLVTARTRAIVVSHMDGYPAPIHEITSFARARKITIIEDCAQSLGATTLGTEVGTSGDLAVFSFTDKKIAVGGEGGMLVLSNRQLYERAVLGGYLQKRSYEDVLDESLRPLCYTGLGLNLRMHPFAAALAHSQLRGVDAVLLRRALTRRAIAAAIAHRHELSWPTPPAAPYRLGEYSIKLLVREDIDAAEYARLLSAEGVPIVKAETRPLHLCTAFIEQAQMRRLFQTEAGLEMRFPNAERFVKRSVRMPPLTGLTVDQLGQIKAAFDKVGDHLISQR